MPAPTLPRTTPGHRRRHRDRRTRPQRHRPHHVAAGTVTNIARDEGLWFPDDWRTQTATDCHRADAALDRAEREAALIDEYLALPTTTRLPDGEQTGAAKKLSYALYDVRRHHDRRI